VSGTLTLPDGARMAFTDSGARDDALPLVMLHAFPLHRGMWASQLAACGLVRRCIAPDLRGFGESTLGDGPVTMDQMARDVVALLDHLAIERAAIAGLSMGGYVAFGIVRQHPERVGALILADTRAAADGEEARMKRADLIALARAEGSEAVAERQLPGLLGKTTRAQRPDLVEATRRMLESASVEAIVAGAEALRDRPDSTTLLESIAVPTLVICGAEDTVTQPREMREMAERIPGSRFVLLEEAGHLSNVEQSDRFDEAVTEFLDEIGKGHPAT